MRKRQNCTYDCSSSTSQLQSFNQNPPARLLPTTWKLPKKLSSCGQKSRNCSSFARSPWSVRMCSVRSLCSPCRGSHFRCVPLGKTLLTSLTLELRSSSRLLLVHHVVHPGMTRLVDHHILFRCNVVQLRAAAAQRCCFLMEANGMWASAVASSKHGCALRQVDPYLRVCF